MLSLFLCQIWLGWEWGGGCVETSRARLSSSSSPGAPADWLEVLWSVIDTHAEAADDDDGPADDP